MRKKGEGKEGRGGGKAAATASLRPPSCCPPDLTAVLPVCQIRAKPELDAFQTRIKAIVKIKLKILLKAVYSGNQVTGSPDHI